MHSGIYQLIVCLLEDLLVHRDSCSLGQFKQLHFFSTEHFLLLYRIFLHVGGDHQRRRVWGGWDRLLWLLSHRLQIPESSKKVGMSKIKYDDATKR